MVTSKTCVPVLVAAFSLLACSDQADAPTDLGRTAVVPVVATDGGTQAGAASVAASSSAAHAKNFSAAPLKGRNEVPARDSKGTGEAKFQVSADGSSMRYKLNVGNIDGVVQAHIHVGAVAANGPVVAFLFGPVPGGVDGHGTLAEGTITDASLIGPLAGMTLADLLAEMMAGNTYVNVHTVAIPSGEIRGQID